jgi:hypothetical protein
MDLPRFTADGLLPPADYPLTIDGLRASYLVTGEGIDVPGWDALWREHLVNNLEQFVRQLWVAGVEQIFVNGSFVTRKPRPGDIDGYFECEAPRFPWIVLRLLQLGRYLPWDWTQRARDPETGILKLRMWHEYRVEIFPHFVDQPQPTGIRDEYGNELPFSSLFRRDKDTGMPKDVIQIVREKPG